MKKAKPPPTHTVLRIGDRLRLVSRTLAWKGEIALQGNTWWSNANFNTPASSLPFNNAFRREDGTIKLGVNFYFGAVPAPASPAFPGTDVKICGASLPKLAHLRHAGRPRECPFPAEDRK